MKNCLTVKKLKTNKKLEKFLKTTKNELDKIFNFKIKEPLIYLLNSRDELDIVWGSKTEKWLVACARNDSIFILHPDIYAEQSDHKEAGDFWKVLKHEYCHIYFKQITGGLYPLWLNEGLANYLADQKKSGGNPMDVFLYFNKTDRSIYKAGYFWVELLIRKFGKAKILKLIKNIDSGMNERSFASEFKKVYGLGFNKKELEKLMKK